VSADAIRLVRQTTLDYLEQHTVITLATQGSLGLWAAAVFYASEKYDIYFISAGHTRHAQNMAETHQVAGTIQEDYHDWAAIKGIQLEGFVELLSGPAKERAITIYGDKYPLIKAANGPIQSALEDMNWYRLAPERVYLVDNSKGFGHRDVVELVDA
jgi:uncharacterized protein YhbP (UPF0306 family)